MYIYWTFIRLKNDRIIYQHAVSQTICAARVILIVVWSKTFYSQQLSQKVMFWHANDTSRHYQVASTSVIPPPPRATRVHRRSMTFVLVALGLTPAHCMTTDRAISRCACLLASFLWHSLRLNEGMSSLPTYRRSPIPVVTGPNV